MNARPIIRQRALVHFLALACSAPFALMSPAWSQPSNNPITALTLSSGGVAEVHRQAKVSGNGTFRIDVPLAQVDDILKSLVVRDAAGTVVGMALDGLSPVDETFSRLPFTAADMGSIPALAGALQGIPVRATSGGRTVEGIVLGVAEYPVGDRANVPNEQVISVMTPDGLTQALRLGADATLEVLDPAMRDRLRNAAEVSGRGRTDTMRSIAIDVAGTGEREVGITYVVPAPVWKTAYRLLTDQDGKVRLQAWAVLENATGEDWNNVAVTLSSGAPVMLTQALHERYWAERPSIPVFATAARPVATDDSGQQNSARAKSMRSTPAAEARVSAEMDYLATGGGSQPAPAPSAPMSRPAAQAQAQEGQTAATYTLRTPVDLEAGRTLSVPFLEVSLKAQNLSLFQPERRSLHPVAAVFLENTTSATLPPGILTVYDAQSGHRGDAQISGIPPGESRFASFAQDTKTTVTTQAKPQEQITQVAIANGVLSATRVSRLTTTYTVKGPTDEARSVIIEHPKRAGWKFKSNALDAETPTRYRLRVNTAAGATASAEAVAERTDTQQIGLLDADQDILLRWSGTAVDATTAQRLKDLAQRRQALAQANGEVNAVESDLERATLNQARVRENLAAVPADSTLGQRYADMLAREEDTIATLEKRREAAEQNARAKRDQLLTAFQ